MPLNPRQVTVTFCFPAGNTALDGLKPGLERAARDVGSVSKEIVSYRLQNGKVAEKRQVNMRLTVIRWQSVQNVLAKLVPPERVHCGHRLSAYKDVQVSAYEGIFG